MIKYTFDNNMINDYFEMDNIDEWGCALLWLGEKEDIGVEYNYCIDNKLNCSGIYKMKMNYEEDIVETDYSESVHYEIDPSDKMWEEKLEKAMLKTALHFYHEEQRKVNKNMEDCKRRKFIEKVKQAMEVVCDICDYKTIGCLESTCPVKENYNRLLKNYLEDCYILSEYTDRDFWLNLNECNVGDTAYMYLHDEKYHEYMQEEELEIVHIVFQSDNYEYYANNLDNGECLFDEETLYGADTSAEFIYDDDCCLVWFKYKK